MADTKVNIKFVGSKDSDLINDSEKFELPLRLKKFYGETLVREISREAKIAAKKFSIVPDTPKFYNSFSYKIVGRTIEIITSWPWIDPLIEGTPEFPMTWLTREKGVNKVPIFLDNGSVIIRTAPLTTQDAWIHPKIAKHTFVEKGIEAAKVKALKKIIDDDSVVGWISRMFTKIFD